MIVPMKKVSLIILTEQKQHALKQLRKAGLVHIQITESPSEKLGRLKEQLSLLESSIFTASAKQDKRVPQKEVSLEQALAAAKEISQAEEEKKNCISELGRLKSELERLKDFGEIDPDDFVYLADKGIRLSVYEMPRAEYQKLDGSIDIVILKKNKKTVKFIAVNAGKNGHDKNDGLTDFYRIQLPDISSKEMREKIENTEECIKTADRKLESLAGYCQSMKNAVKVLKKEIEFETYASGMEQADLSDSGKESPVSVSCFEGYTEAQNLDKLKQLARQNRWGLAADEPTTEDDVPTKLKNNKFVSLIYPLTDFLGTVPGYFEYDISSWFLGFILIFFGIIFGDGGYGLLICAAAAVFIVKSLLSKKKVSASFLLLGLFGLSTVIWGTLTCTWFGLSAELIPTWLKNLSVPVISNVYSDKIWYPFWTDGQAGLTTAQNLQILCFSLALIQLTAAHVKCAVRDRKSLKILGDIGSIFQLIGIYYVVLSLVVNSQVFSFGLVISGINVGALAIGLTAAGFILSFIFSNYAGNIIKSVLESLKNIVSVLLGVVNVFSDIVSYIRLWAVGLAGAAISATVNELVSPLLGNFMFMVLALILLVFGHGLNIILNVLSVIVHGIRLNTLEFSSHLDMSWSGHKFKPFEE